MLIDFAEDVNRYKLMSQTVIPRPIAWIVTKDEGVVNIAPFSYFTPLSSDPAVLIVSLGHKSDGSPKDTLANLRKTKKATICIAHEDQLEKLHFSSKSLPKNQSEAKEFDIELETVEKDFPPIVKDVPAAYFCEFYDEVNLPGSKTRPIIVQIKSLHVDERYVLDKENHYFDFKPLARVGKHYGKFGEFVEGPAIV